MSKILELSRLSLPTNNLGVINPLGRSNSSEYGTLSNVQQQSDKVMISEKQVDNDASFFATFTDGSSFRNLVEYIRLVSREGVFRFTKRTVLYEQGDDDNNILNVAELKTHELSDYEFISKSDEIVVGTNMSDLRNITRNVGKKDHIDLYKLSDEPGNLYIRIRSQSEKGSETTYLLPITSSNYTVYKLAEYSRGKRNPTCTVYQGDFSKLCKSLVTIKCSHAMVHGFEHGIIYKGILNTGKIGSVKEFGKCRNNSSSTQTPLKSFYPSGSGTIIKANRPPPRLNIGEIGEIERFRIDISIIKYLIKLNALSPTGTIKIYVEKGLPLKMVCNIGSFGKMNVYLMG